MIRRTLRKWPGLLRLRSIYSRLRRGEARPVRLCAHPAPEDATVSVVIPVKDAGAELRDLLQRIGEQQGFRAVQAVVVDSGSSDGSAELAEAMGACVVRITPAEFSHSHARNLGAERASGDYVLFTVQDALPSSAGWLHEMFSGLRRHQAAAVTCGEEPRADADLFYRAISWYHNRFMSPDGSDVVMERSPMADDALSRRRNGQLSDTACLIGRDLFLRHRHRGHYAEDLDLGLRLSGDGYRLAFLGATRIVHSHNRPAYYHLRRSYVEHLALYDMVAGYPMAEADAAAVMDDIPRSLAMLDDLVCVGLAALSTPCSTERLRTAVREALGAAPAVGAAHEAPGDYVDARTRAFASALPRPSSSAPGVPSRSALAEAVAFMAGIICDYLDHAWQRALERESLEEFKAALYKAWAVQCGVHLASAYWRAPRGEKERLNGVHEELTRAV